MKCFLHSFSRQFQRISIVRIWLVWLFHETELTQIGFSYIKGSNSRNVFEYSMEWCRISYWSATSKCFRACNVFERNCFILYQSWYIRSFFVQTKIIHAETHAVKNEIFCILNWKGIEDCAKFIKNSIAAQRISYINVKP